MKYSLSDIIKDLLAKIPVLENRINTLSTKITNLATNGATKVNAKVPNGSEADLVFGIMANNDSARIRVGGSSDSGWVEIATADNGDEPIYARQYCGGFEQNSAKTVTNEAVLLDGNGNTKFPHNVTAANFVGHLAGNADTATIANKANTADNASHATSADSATKIVNNGNRNNLADGTKPPSGLSVYQCYTHSGYPQPYGNVISIGGTGDNELFFCWRDDARGPRPWYRSKIDVYNDWTSWKPLAFISDINNYAPTKTGGGASGTWGISISGNAASATNADTVDGYHAADLQSALNTEVSNRQAADKALKSRLDGNEFVKSKNGENNIALKYEQKDGEDKKTLHTYVDGVDVPFNTGLEEVDFDSRILTFKPILRYSDMGTWNGGTSGLVQATGEIEISYTEHSGTQVNYSSKHGTISLGEISSTNIDKSATISGGYQSESCAAVPPEINRLSKAAQSYISEHLDDFKAKAFNAIPESKNAIEFKIMHPDYAY